MLTFRQEAKQRVLTSRKLYLEYQERDDFYQTEFLEEITGTATPLDMRQVSLVNTTNLLSLNLSPWEAIKKKALSTFWLVQVVINQLDH